MDTGARRASIGVNAACGAIGKVANRKGSSALQGTMEIMI